MNTNVIISETGGVMPQYKDTLLLPSDDVVRYQNGTNQRPFYLTKWQLTDLFELYDSIALRVSNIENPDKVRFELVPYDDILKRTLLIDISNDYYFVLFKIDIPFEWTTNLFSVKIAKNTDNMYYIYFLLMSDPDDDEGAGEEPPTNGVRIHKP